MPLWLWSAIPFDFDVVWALPFCISRCQHRRQFGHDGEELESSRSLVVIGTSPPSSSLLLRQFFPPPIRGSLRRWDLERERWTFWCCHLLIADLCCFFFFKVSRDVGGFRVWYAYVGISVENVSIQSIASKKCFWPWTIIPICLSFDKNYPWLCVTQSYHSQSIYGIILALWG